MPKEKTVAVWYTIDDYLELWEDHYSFQFAKSVVGTDGELTFNVVWQSCALSPSTSIKWTPVYGLNWTLSLPTGGLVVDIGGLWQQCDLGESYDILDTGLWAPSDPSSATCKKDYLNIGNNGFKYGEYLGIHILVGIKNGAGTFDVIYVDPKKIGIGMHASYQPQETCQWWYQAGARTGTMISDIGTKIHQYDMSHSSPKTGKFYVATRYDFATGTWVDQAEEPPRTQLGLIRTAGWNEDINSKELKLLKDKMTQLEQMLSSFLKGNLSSGSKDGDFIGTIIWPQNTAEAVRAEGISAVCQSLKDQGYFTGDEWNQATNASIVTFCLIGSLQPSGISLRDKAIWDDAFATITAGNPRNGGLDRITTHQQTTDPKAQAKAVMNKKLNGYQELINA